MNKLMIFMMGLSVLIFSCTDLEVVELDSEVVDTPEGGFTGVNVEANLTDAYNGLNALGDQANIYALMEVTSDAQLVPTRGTDWGDNGVWRTLHQHTWDASHQFVLTAWNQLNSGTFRINQILESNPNAQQEAEARFIRAFLSFLIVDFWGILPDRGPRQLADELPNILTRAEAVARIEQDLSDAQINNLPAIGPGNNNQILKASQASAHYLRAKFLLNKHILLNGAETNPEPQQADLQKVVESVDFITNAGFALEEDFFKIFDPAADNESIFILNANAGNRIYNTVHYAHSFGNLNPGGGWNGFCTTAEFYALFEGPATSNAPNSGQEIRRGFVPNNGLGFGMLFGQQFDDQGRALTTRSGAPLNFSRELPGLAGNTEETGIRLIKYHPENGGEFPQYQILFRYADAFLMKAEAQLRLGQSTEALTMVNQLRTLRGATPFTSLSLSDMLDERGRELYIEFWRRQDQIRFGDFLRDWPYKGGTSDPSRLLFPIPVLALSSNPNLVQNPGY